MAQKLSFPSTNSILRALPGPVRRRLSPHLEPVILAPATLLFGPHKPAQHVHFLDSGTVALLLAADGTKLVVGIIGRAGSIGSANILANSQSTYQAVVLRESRGYRIAAKALCEEFKQGGALQELLLRDIYLLHAQLSQTTLCNTMHPPLERLSRWLLMLRDQVQSEAVNPITEFAIAPQFIDAMAGMRPVTTHLATNTLQHAGLVAYQDGCLTILNHEGLEGSACECYAALRNRFKLSAT